MDFDEYYRQTSEFGPFQIAVVVLLTIPGCIMNVYNMFATSFVIYEPTHSCQLDSENLTGWIADACEIRSNTSTNSSMPCPHGWTFDTTYFDRTIVTDYSLFCARNEVTIALLVFGISAVLGSLLIGWLQDRFGHRIAFLSSTLFYVLGGALSAAAPTLLIFTIVRAVFALSTLASWNVCYTWALEFVGPTRRTPTSTIFCLVFAMGSVSLSVIAYLCRTWISFTLVTTLPFGLTCVYYCFIPDSPRWLLMQGKHEELRAVLARMATWNRQARRDDLIDKLLISSETAEAKPERTGKLAAFDLKTLQIFRGPNLRKKTTIVTFCWIANTVTYTTIGYNIDNIGGNLFLTYAIIALMEAPAAVLNLFTLNRYGRIWPLCIGMLVAGVCLLLTAPGPDRMPSSLIVALTALGKLGISSSFDAIYQVAGELYPTEVRGTGIAFSSTIGDIGNIVMPFIILSAETYRMLPSIILGALCFLSGAFILLLPETRNRCMPETLSDGELHGRVGVEALKENVRNAGLICRSSRIALERCFTPSRGVRTRESSAMSEEVAPGEEHVKVQAEHPSSTSTRALLKQAARGEQLVKKSVIEIQI